uniref:Anaphase-promoting complex subunit 11 RING-H2 finger domain-containing protein n=1 Tax=Varanus komodoensis TaxID=61221 RepID=A0A8D2KT99_VARKO
SAHPGTYPTVGRGSVPAASPGQSGSVPHRAATARSASSASASPAASARSSSATTTAATGPPSSTSLTPVEFNNIIQRHIHFVAHDGGFLRLPGPTLPAALDRGAETDEAGIGKTRRGRKSARTCRVGFLCERKKQATLSRGVLWEWARKEAWETIRGGTSGTILSIVCNLDIMKVKIKSWHGVASWLWVANDENCGICRMAFNGCCPDCRNSLVNPFLLNLFSFEDSCVHDWKKPREGSRFYYGGAAVQQTWQCA